MTWIYVIVGKDLEALPLHRLSISHYIIFYMYMYFTSLKLIVFSSFLFSIHICITDMHTAPGVADRFITDVRSAVAEIMKDPKEPVSGKMALYGMAQTIPDRSIVGEVTRCYINSMYYIPPAKLNK